MCPLCAKTLGDLENWHGLLEFDVVPTGSVYSFGYEF